MALSWIFFSKNHAYKTKQIVYYISVDSDLEMDIVLSKKDENRCKQTLASLP